MNKDPNIIIDQIWLHINHIETYTQNLSKQQFLTDTKTQDAIIRKIEIIGEAAKRLPQHFKNQNLNINWKRITGMRDVLIHDYFEMSLDIIWNTAITDIPKLKKAISQIIKSSS